MQRRSCPRGHRQGVPARQPGWRNLWTRLQGVLARHPRQRHQTARQQRCGQRPSGNRVCCPRPSASPSDPGHGRPSGQAAAFGSHAWPHAGARVSRRIGRRCCPRSPRRARVLSQHRARRWAAAAADMPELPVPPQALTQMFYNSERDAKTERAECPSSQSAPETRRRSRTPPTPQGTGLAAAESARVARRVPRWHRRKSPRRRAHGTGRTRQTLIGAT